MTVFGGWNDGFMVGVLGDGGGGLGGAVEFYFAAGFGAEAALSF